MALRIGESYAPLTSVWCNTTFLTDHGVPQHRRPPLLIGTRAGFSPPRTRAPPPTVREALRKRTVENTTYGKWNAEVYNSTYIQESKSWLLDADAVATEWEVLTTLRTQHNRRRA
ncbi:MAG: hypothetical protein ISQ15_09890 [Ilumatobacteraceae bacterium]|nr:hypothetical protein [Ilumatobacteraceae bacterium]